jgi:hypothetical protein
MPMEYPVTRVFPNAGYEAAEGLLKACEFPDHLTEIERISFIATGINCVLYASLENPSITSESRCEFDILWCPHQDLYTAFDCRVQRYFVEGMLEAMEAHGINRAIPMLDKLIPKGAECCHFVVDRVQADGTQNPWHAYSEKLAARALDRIEPDE